MLPPAADFLGFLLGAPPPLPPLAVLVRVVDHCRSVFLVGPSAAPGVGVVLYPHVYLVHLGLL